MVHAESPSWCGLLMALWLRMGLSVTQVVIVLVPAAGIVIAMLAAKLFSDALFMDFAADPAFLAKVHPLTGALSNLGVLLWHTTAVACLFTAAVLRTRGARESRFFYSAGLLSGYLAFDDMFMIHEYFVPRYIGVDEKFAVALLGVVAMIFFFRFRQVILRSAFGLLVLSLGFLSLSVFIDALGGRFYDYSDWQYFAEDTPKWFGIACWCGYFLRFCYRESVDSDRLRPAAG